MKRLTGSLLALAFVLALALPAAAVPVPKVINYQGVLTDDSGTPLDGDYSIRFTVYADSVGGSSIWHETHTALQVDEGLFHVLLGSVTPMPDDLWTSPVGAARWLAIQVSPDAEMTPRMKVTSVPFAAYAAVADTVLHAPSGGAGDGHSLDAADGSPTDAVYVDDDGDVGVGTTTPGHDVEIFDPTSATLALHTTTAGSGTSEILLFWDESGQNAYIGAYDPANSAYPNAMVFGNGRTDGKFIWTTGFVEKMRLANNGNFGIGTSNPAQKLDVAGTAEVDGFKMPTGAAAGRVLTADASGVGTWQAPSGGSDSDWVISGSDMYSGVTGEVGIGVTNPLAKLHVQGPDATSTVLVTPNVGSSGSSRLALASGTSGLFGGLVKFDGSAGKLQLGGKYYDDEFIRFEIDWLNPYVEIKGSTQSAYFDMSAAGSNTVMLPSSAIGSTEMQNEPGVASAEEGSSSAYLGGGVQTLLSRSITHPTGGYVLVLGSGQVRVDHVSGSYSQANFGVSNTSGSLPDNQDVVLDIPTSAPSGAYQLPVTVQSIFPVSTTGTTTFYFMGQGLNGNISVYDMQLSVLFVPTAYGTVAFDESMAGGVPDELAETMAPPTAAEIEAERAETERLSADRLAREIEEIRAELEAIKAGR